MNPPPLSIVVPCFDEEAVLPELHRRMTAAAKGAVGDYELLLVNDGSRDGTWACMQRLAEEDGRVVAVNLSRNHGHQLALSAGLAVSRGHRVLIIDADLQDPPELLPRMMALMDQGADVVYGRRTARAGEGWGKRATAAIFYRVIGVMTETPIPADTGDFRLISRRALNVLLAMPERHRFVRGMVSWVGFRQVALGYDRAARTAGQTKYPLRKMVRFAKDAITGFSIKPLTIASYLGGFAAVVAAGLIIYTLAIWFHGGTVTGWTSLMAALAFFSSVQLLVLGVIGEYLGRLYEQSKGRPLFVIESIVTQQGRSSDGGPLHGGLLAQDHLNCSDKDDRSKPNREPGH